MDKSKEKRKISKVREEAGKEHVRIMQEINMRNAESKLMINSLDLLRNETVERTKEYFTIEHQTVKHNEEEVYRYKYLFIIYIYAYAIDRLIINSNCRFLDPKMYNYW